LSILALEVTKPLNTFVSTSNFTPYGSFTVVEQTSLYLALFGGKEFGGSIFFFHAKSFIMTVDRSKTSINFNCVNKECFTSHSIDSITPARTRVQKNRI
jgi:hypothetical protein